MKSTKLIASIFFIWACLSYILITQLYKKNVTQNHSVVANVLSRALIQDAILNDQIKIKASISDFIDSATDVAFICITSADKIVSYVGDTEMHQRTANESECIETKNNSSKVDIVNIVNNHEVHILDLKIFWAQENISLVWIKENPIIFLSAVVLLGILLMTLKFVFNREQGLLLESSIQELIKNQEPSEYLKNRFPYLASKWLEMKNTVEVLSSERIRNEKAASIAELAAQVSHDIRSPLSALTMLMGNINELPENKRILARNAIQRINDIANCLTERSKKSSKSSSLNQNEESKTDGIDLIPAIVDTIVSEKRLQFRDYIDVDIDCELKDSYGAFADVDSLELKRIVSNLINNSVEAMPNHKGKVSISIHTRENSIDIIIKDNGCGIPEKVLKKIGEQGFSYGKENMASGSGLGIHHAKKTINNFGGKFHIESMERVGTTVSISLPKATTPVWFVDNFTISKNFTIVICDDDLSIHQIWSGRFKSLFGEGCQIVSFSSGDLFKNWILENENENCIFLVDYELINQSSTGLDMIDELQIQSQSILVTSRYEEVNIRDRAKKLGLKMIPKAMVPYVPIKERKPQILYDACLIDDDTQLIHQVWSVVAASKGLNVRMFSTAQEFISAVDTIDRLTPIYIDVSLGAGVNGIAVAEDLHKFGFIEINLATGHMLDLSVIPPFIHQVVGKDFPELI